MFDEFYFNFIFFIFTGLGISSSIVFILLKSIKNGKNYN